MAPKTNNFANVNNPIIEAVMEGLFSFRGKADAVRRLESIKSQFTTSKQQPEGKDKDAIIIWVQNFEITADEKKQGFLGNYALIAAEKNEQKEFVLTITKLESELKYHPKRKRPKQRHPNWGHPILRSLKKGRKYKTIEHVAAEFQQLQEEFPDATIPAKGNRLHLMIYDRAANAKSPVHKYILQIKPSDDGGFYIDYEENTYKAPLVAKKEEGETEPPQGYFTSMIALKKHSKKRPEPKDDA